MAQLPFLLDWNYLDIHASVPVSRGHQAQSGPNLIFGEMQEARGMSSRGVFESGSSIKPV